MWVARSIALVLLVASCDLPTQPPIASPSPSTAAASCRLPVWWGEATGLGVHGAFVNVPGGTVTDAGTIPQPPQLTKGNHRHAFPWARAVIADGAAWGFEMRGESSSRNYTVLRLDRVTHDITEWFDGPADTGLNIQGVDIRHRLYVASFNHVYRVDSPTQVSDLPDDPPVVVTGGFGLPPVLASDSRGAWLGMSGGIRLLQLGAAPT